MRKKVTRSEFKRIVAEEVLVRLGNLGFKEYGPGTFGRQQEGYVQGLGVSPDVAMMKFCVRVGFVLPSLWDKTAFVLGAHTPALEISHRLGQFRNSLTGLETWYHFYTEGELRACFDRVHDDFLDQALPWFERFATLQDVVDEYYRYRIAPLPDGERRSADPFASAMYGWMLQLVGQPVKSREWLMRARDQIAEQIGANGYETSHVSPELQRLRQAVGSF